MQVRATLLIVLILMPISVWAQVTPAEVVQLQQKLETTIKPDQKVDILTSIANIYLTIDLDKSVSYAERGIFLSIENQNPHGEAKARKAKASAYYYKGRTALAIEQYNRAYNIMDSLGNMKGVAELATDIAQLFIHLGNDDKAYEYYDKALSIRQQDGHRQQEADLLRRISSIYYRAEAYSKAIRNLRVSINILDSLGATDVLPLALNSLGECYRIQQRYNLAIYQHEKAYSISSKSGARYHMAYSLIKIAEAKIEQGQPEGLQIKLSTAIQLAKEVKNSYLEIQALTAMGRYHMMLREGKLAKLYANEAYQIAKKNFHSAREVGFLRDMVKAIDLLFNISALEKDYQKALAYQTRLISYKDSLAKLEKGSIIQTVELNQILEQRDERLAREARQKEYYKRITELQEQSIEYWITIWGVVILLGAAIAVLQLRANYKNKRLNLELNERNQEVEARSQELNTKYDEVFFQNESLAIANKKVALQNQVIIDGLKSAKDIQSNLLPSDEYLFELFPNHFLIYLPKEMVSGDFYWANEINGKKIIAVADCTGHGVSGALTSMLGINFISQAVLEMGLEDPGEILREMQKSFQKNIAHAKTRSAIGMEVAICLVDEEAQTVKFGGIRSHLYYSIGQGELQEIKGDRHPISKGSEKDLHQYESQEIQYGDEQMMIFFASDGYKDQHGGLRGDRQHFSPRRFRDLMSEIKLYGPEHQRMELINNLNNWMGGAELQTDDILVLGIRLNSQKLKLQDELEAPEIKAAH